MRIYFYDGPLSHAPKPVRGYLSIPIDAAYGPMTCEYELDNILKLEDNNSIDILSNSLVALSHTYGWNEKEGHTDIYIWRNDLDQYIRIDQLVDKDIRRPHNIEKMYRAGVFNPN